MPPPTSIVEFLFKVKMPRHGVISNGSCKRLKIISTNWNFWNETILVSPRLKNVKRCLSLFLPQPHPAFVLVSKHGRKTKTIEIFNRNIFLLMARFYTRPLYTGISVFIIIICQIRKKLLSMLKIILVYTKFCSFSLFERFRNCEVAKYSPSIHYATYSKKFRYISRHKLNGACLIENFWYSIEHPTPF